MCIRDRHLYEQSGLVELLQSWPKQYDQSLVPSDVIAMALQTAEIAATTIAQFPVGQEHTDPTRRARRQRTFGSSESHLSSRHILPWPSPTKNGQECKTAEEYDEATLATRDFWFQPPIRYEQAWAPTLATYREHIDCLLYTSPSPRDA